MHLPIKISEESREPIFYQIETQLKSLIISGQLPYNALLPSIRTLAKDLSCSVITTRRAYQDLESQGFIKTIQGKGTFVRSIDKEHRSETQRKLMVATFQTAIEQAEKMGCTIEMMNHIFHQIMRDRYGEGADKK